MPLLAYSAALDGHMTCHRKHNVQEHISDMDYTHALGGILLRSKIQEVIYLDNDGEHPLRIMVAAGAVKILQNTHNDSK